jgi:hypothetical protein
MPTIYAIRDAHNREGGRKTAESTLTTPAFNIGVYFVEYAAPLDSQNYMTQMSGLDQDDAEPTLLAIVDTAVHNNIDIVPCDMTAAATMAALNTQMPGWIIGPQGVAIRNQHAVGQIAQYYQTHPNARNGLLMYGVNHFEAAHVGANDTLQALIANAGIPGLDYHPLY